jgi:hypothetical protein
VTLGACILLSKTKHVTLHKTPKNASQARRWAVVNSHSFALQAAKDSGFVAACGASYNAPQHDA